ncbi:hypothetical protein [Cohnella nanjingensis]|uniref:Uncharacterized protein n=1 Tax=Cohnella nanjingensis TaxID=1387779 RepID=A0A7X0RXI0_9BACL|nr:hypothetical protein [Cohnella nanjingensis]MBB6674175.1 hypothetical protein [Cohnella nanjingensis]
MKIGTFVMGGLAGAAVVLLMQRNGRMAAMAGQVGQRMKHRMSGMKEDAFGKMLNMSWSGSDRHGGSDSHRGSDRHASNRSSSESGGLEQVAHLASQDAKVKREVNDILNQSGHDHI